MNDVVGFVIIFSLIALLLSALIKAVAIRFVGFAVLGLLAFLLLSDNFDTQMPDLSNWFRQVSRDFSALLSPQDTNQRLDDFDQPNGGVQQFPPTEFDPPDSQSPITDSPTNTPITPGSPSPEFGDQPPVQQPEQQPRRVRVQAEVRRRPVTALW